MPPKRPAPSRSHAPNKFPRQASFPAAARSRAIKEISRQSEEEDDINEEMKAKLARKEARVSLTSMSSHERCSPGMRRGIHRVLSIALWTWFSEEVEIGLLLKWPFMGLAPQLLRQFQPLLLLLPMPDILRPSPLSSHLPFCNWEKL